jgi:hypothetical protein
MRLPFPTTPRLAALALAGAFFGCMLGAGAGGCSSTSDQPLPIYDGGPIVDVTMIEGGEADGAAEGSATEAGADSSAKDAAGDASKTDGASAGDGAPGDGAPADGAKGDSAAPPPADAGEDHG